MAEVLSIVVNEDAGQPDGVKAKVVIGMAQSRDRGNAIRVALAALIGAAEEQGFKLGSLLDKDERDYVDQSLRA